MTQAKLYDTVPSCSYSTKKLRGVQLNGTVFYQSQRETKQENVHDLTHSPPSPGKAISYVHFLSRSTYPHSETTLLHLASRCGTFPRFERTKFYFSVCLPVCSHIGPARQYKLRESELGVREHAWRAQQWVGDLLKTKIEGILSIFI
jgi:hypothetical protein